MMMREVLKRVRGMILVGVMVLCGTGVPVMGAIWQSEVVYAAGTTCERDADGKKVDETCVDTNILNGTQGIYGILGLVLNILIYGLGAAATIGVVIAGLMYLSARDNPQMVAKAKVRLIEISIGLLVWAMLFVLLQFLLPGFSGVKTTK